MCLLLPENVPLRTLKNWRVSEYRREKKKLDSLSAFWNSPLYGYDHDEVAIVAAAGFGFLELVLAAVAAAAKKQVGAAFPFFWQLEPKCF